MRVGYCWCWGGYWGSWHWGRGAGKKSGMRSERQASPSSRSFPGPWCCCCMWRTKSHLCHPGLRSGLLHEYGRRCTVLPKEHTLESGVQRLWPVAMCVLATNRLSGEFLAVVNGRKGVLWLQSLEEEACCGCIPSHCQPCWNLQLTPSTS